MPIRRILVTLAAILGLFVTSAPAAHAAPKAAPAAPSSFAMACTWFGCANITNLSWSDASVLIAPRYYSSTYNPTARRLYPGQNSRKYMKDVNALWIPTGCKAFNSRSGGWFYGGRWYRIGTLSYSINVQC